MTPEKVIYITWLSVALCFSWPLSVGSSRNKVFGFKILQVATVISAIMMLVPLMYSIYLHLDDMVIVSKSFSAVTSVSQIAVHTFICFIKHDSFQVSSYSFSLNIQCKRIQQRRYSCSQAYPHICTNFLWIYYVCYTKHFVYCDYSGTVRNKLKTIILQLQDI